MILQVFSLWKTNECLLKIDDWKMYLLLKWVGTSQGEGSASEGWVGPMTGFRKTCEDEALKFL